MAGKAENAAVVVFLLLAGSAAVYVSSIFWGRDVRGEDVYMCYAEGKRLLQRQNPYARTLASDMRFNRTKYATYFPLAYLLSAFTQLMGYRDFEQWMGLWRLILLLCNLGIGGLLFHAFYRRGRPFLGALAMLVWFFNRWTLYVGWVAHIDFLPLLLFLLSLRLFERHRWTSLFLYSASLAYKQIAVFVLPLYLIWTWQRTRKGVRLKATANALIVMMSLPLLLSIPFIFWGAKAYIKSILFSATRLPDCLAGAPSLDVVLLWDGLLARVPMLLLMLLVYSLAWTRRIGAFAAAMLTLLVFIDFNPVLFSQYGCWLVPLIVLVLLESLPRAAGHAQAAGRRMLSARDPETLTAPGSQ